MRAPRDGRRTTDDRQQESIPCDGPAIRISCISAEYVDFPCATTRDRAAGIRYGTGDRGATLHGTLHGRYEHVRGSVAYRQKPFNFDAVDSAAGLYALRAPAQWRMTLLRTR